MDPKHFHFAIIRLTFVISRKEYILQTCEIGILHSNSLSSFFHKNGPFVKADCVAGCLILCTCGPGIGIQRGVTQYYYIVYFKEVTGVTATDGEKAEFIKAYKSSNNNSKLVCTFENCS